VAIMSLLILKLIYATLKVRGFMDFW